MEFILDPDACKVKVYMGPIQSHQGSLGISWDNSSASCMVHSHALTQEDEHQPRKASRGSAVQSTHFSDRETGTQG